MTITIFGASGRTGQHLVRATLKKGYLVKAFVRDGSRLRSQDPRIEVIEGDVCDLVAVERAVIGSNAVLSALGWTKTSRTDVLSEASKNIVAAMEKYQVKRIIVLTGYGVSFPKDPPDSLGKKLLHLGIKILLPHLVPDGIRYAKTIVESGLDWTIVRASILSSRKSRGSYQAGYFDPGIRMVSREDVADFMVEQITGREYVHEAPVVA